MFLPPPVRPESKVALIAPASRIDPAIVDALIEAYKTHGDEFPGSELVVYPSVRDAGACGSYSASVERRIADLHDALADEDVDLIICARGGYGCVHLADSFHSDFISSHPKWLVGFSDVSALHALFLKAGVASIHGGMAKQLVENTDCGYRPYRRQLKALVETSHPQFSYCADADRRNICGSGEGILIGGNLAVLNGLAATPLDLMGQCLKEDVILFIEDISEPIYAVERMLWRLHLQGVLDSVKGILVGQFTEWKPDRNFVSMYEMISSAFRAWNVSCPVAFNFPVGHNDHNVPLIEGARVCLSVDSRHVILESTHFPVKKW